jgi:hypothetical protein
MVDLTPCGSLSGAGAALRGGFKGGAGSFPYLRQDLDQFLRQLARVSIANLTPQTHGAGFHRAPYRALAERADARRASRYYPFARRGPALTAWAIRGSGVASPTHRESRILRGSLYTALV